MVKLMETPAPHRLIQTTHCPTCNHPPTPPTQKEMSTNPILNFFLALNWSCKNGYTLTLSNIEKLFDFEALKTTLP